MPLVIYLIYYFIIMILDKKITGNLNLLIIFWVTFIQASLAFENKPMFKRRNSIV